MTDPLGLIIGRVNGPSVEANLPEKVAMVKGSSPVPMSIRGPCGRGLFLTALTLIKRKKKSMELCNGVAGHWIQRLTQLQRYMIR